MENKKFKVLNCYAGIGGNRIKWGPEAEVTAVELDERIADIYKDLHPQDRVIVGDAHEILLEIAEQFDYIWCSPPCPTHSVTSHFLHAQGIKRYPDMSLYQEIIYLQHLIAKHPNKRYTVENVKPYYQPLIPAQKSGRHLFWANFKIPKFKAKPTIGRMGPVKSKNNRPTSTQSTKNLSEYHKSIGIDLTKYKHPDKVKLLNNMVDPDIGKAIYDKAYQSWMQSGFKQAGIFGQRENGRE